MRMTNYLVRVRVTRPIEVRVISSSAEMAEDVVRLKLGAGEYEGYRPNGDAAIASIRATPEPRPRSAK